VTLIVVPAAPVAGVIESWGPPPAEALAAKGIIAVARAPTSASVAAQLMSWLRRGFGCGAGDGACHRWPSQKDMIDRAPFGSPANFESSVALRPRLATGVPVRGRRLMRRVVC
jgi:hypothetical protein